jgi:hypothetical protein
LTGSILSDWAGLTEQYAKLEAIKSKKTGNLQRSIRLGEINEVRQYARVVAGGTRLVASTKSPGQSIQSGYAKFVEYGTRAHEIRPRRKKVLFFASQKALSQRAANLEGSGFIRGGSTFSRRKSGNLTEASNRKFGTLAYVYAKSVHHPGTRAQPFLRPGATRALERVGLREHAIKIWNESA